MFYALGHRYYEIGTWELEPVIISGGDSYYYILNFSRDMLDIICSISCPVFSFCYWGGCTFNSMVLQVCAVWPYTHWYVLRPHSLKLCWRYFFCHNIFVARYWILHQSHNDVHILHWASEGEQFIALGLEVQYLLAISSSKHRLFAVRYVRSQSERVINGT